MTALNTIFNKKETRLVDPPPAHRDRGHARRRGPGGARARPARRRARRRPLGRGSVRARRRVRRRVGHRPLGRRRPARDDRVGGLLQVPRRTPTRRSASSRRARRRRARCGSGSARCSASTSVHFNSYEATYGTLGGAIIFLTWLWLSNIALLVGRRDQRRARRYPRARGSGSGAARRYRPSMVAPRCRPGRTSHSRA